MDFVKGREAISSALDREDKPSSTKRIEKNGETVPFDGYLTDVFGEQAIEFLEDDSEATFFSLPLIYCTTRSNACN